MRILLLSLALAGCGADTRTEPTEETEMADTPAEAMEEVTEEGAEDEELEAE